MKAKNIIAIVIVIALAIGGYNYYIDATAPLETKLEPTDRIVFDILSEGAPKFKNPASVRISEGYLSKSQDSITVRLTGENSYGGHTSSVYVIKKGGDMIDYSSKELKKDGEIMFNAGGITGTKINAEKVNAAFASHHK